MELVDKTLNMVYKALMTRMYEVLSDAELNSKVNSDYFIVFASMAMLGVSVILSGAPHELVNQNVNALMAVAEMMVLGVSWGLVMVGNDEQIARAAA